MWNTIFSATFTLPSVSSTPQPEPEAGQVTRSSLLPGLMGLLAHDLNREGGIPPFPVCRMGLEVKGQ